MSVIYKYEVPPLDQLSENGGTFSLELPPIEEVLDFQIQRYRLCFWLQFKNGKPATRLYTFRIVGTGNDFDNEAPYTWTYIGSVQDGPFVWHLYLSDVYDNVAG